MSRRRLVYVAAMLMVIAAGLLWRRPEFGLPLFAAKYGGSALWGAMVFCAVGASMPSLDRKRLALVAMLVSATVEFSQLLHIGWLDDFRSTGFGQLLLGRTFTWADIAAYWTGIGIAFLIARKCEARG